MQCLVRSFELSSFGASKVWNGGVSMQLIYPTQDYSVRFFVSRFQFQNQCNLCKQGVPHYSFLGLDLVHIKNVPGTCQDLHLAGQRLHCHKASCG